MVRAKRARTAETPKQTSSDLRLRASYFYPDLEQDPFPFRDEAADAAQAVHGLPHHVIDLGAVHYHQFRMHLGRF